MHRELGVHKEKVKATHTLNQNAPDQSVLVSMSQYIVYCPTICEIKFCSWFKVSAINARVEDESDAGVDWKLYPYLPICEIRSLKWENAATAP